tara:strand:+ start:665 stop:1183 length:519 start_codon:yes stop_codon:yes gene_type:complete
MDTRQTVKLIEAIVRKVVREELRPIIKEVKQTKPKKTKRVKKVKDVDPFDVSHIFTNNGTINEQTSKPKPKKNFSKDKVLNGLLTETYESDEWRNMNGNSMYTSQNAQGFGRANMAEMIGYGSSQPTVNNMAPTVDPDGRPMDVNLEGTGVGKALTRDYSALMKKLNSKKGV